jgi:hypothetical protein
MQKIDQSALQALDKLRIVFHGLAAGNRFRSRDQLELLRVVLRVCGYVVEQIGAVPACRKTRVF